MINHIQFPALGLEFTVNRVAFSIFGLDVYWYGILVTAGMIAGVAAGLYRAKRIGIDIDKFTDVIMICAFVGIVCARIYYVAFAPFKYDSLWDMINLRDGGLAIYGGIIGGFISGYFACKRKKLNFADCFDCAAVGFPIAQAIGRWGNFVNRECFGTNTDGLLGMISENTISYLKSVQSTLRAQGVIVNPEMPVHPTFLYESVWCFIGFLILFFYFEKRKFKGEITCMYAVWYGIGRFFIEGIRTDSLEILPGIRTSQIVAALMVVFGVIAIIYFRKNKTEKKDKTNVGKKHKR